MFTTSSLTRVVGTVATVALVGAAGIAQTAHGSDSSWVKYNAAITKGTFNLTSLTKQAGGPTDAHPVVRNGEIMEHVSGYASGGSWTDAECQAAGDAINALVGLAVDSFIQGDYGSAAVYANEAEATENEALDGGCGIKYSKGAAPPDDDPVLL